MSEKPGKDTLYHAPLQQVAGFAFDAKVAAVFEDMISRSVPGYGLTLSMLGVLAEQHMQEDANIYDLGCSLGAGIAAVRSRIPQASCRIIGIDSSAAMLERCRKLLERQESSVAVDLVCADIRDVTIANACMAVLNFTLQFVPIDDRLSLLRGIHAGLRPGGVLVLSEKIAFTDATEQAFQTDMHHAFKRAQGYSELEVSQKRAALENVLIPETIDTHLARLRQAGFAHAHVWFQCFNFASIVAYR